MRQQVGKKCTNAGAQDVDVRPCSLTDGAAVQKLAEAVLADYGHVDVLVNAAGMFEYSGALEGSVPLLELLIYCARKDRFDCTSFSCLHAWIVQLHALHFLLYTLTEYVSEQHLLKKYFERICCVATGDPDAFDKLLYLNLSSPIRLTRVLAPAMAEKGDDANIINISSVAGRPLEVLFCQSGH